MIQPLVRSYGPQLCIYSFFDRHFVIELQLLDRWHYQKGIARCQISWNWTSEKTVLFAHENGILLYGSLSRTLRNIASDEITDITSKSISIFIGSELVSFESSYQPMKVHSFKAVNSHKVSFSHLATAKSARRDFGLAFYEPNRSIYITGAEPATERNYSFNLDTQ